MVWYSLLDWKVVLAYDLYKVLTFCVCVCDLCARILDILERECDFSRPISALQSKLASLIC